jgi:hypothetical protein
MSRIDDPAPLSVVQKPPEKRFTLALKARAPKLPPKTLLPTLKNARVPLKTMSGAAVLKNGADVVRARTEARTQMHAESARLRSVRAEDDVRDSERQEVRLRKLVEQELVSNPPSEVREQPHGTEPEPLPISEGVREAGSGPSRSQSRAESMMELVEKLTLFVKSQRPALAMSLGGAAGGRVEVERVGPKTVALRVDLKSGLGARDVESLRSALAARGLTLARYDAA